MGEVLCGVAGTGDRVGCYVGEEKIHPNKRVIVIRWKVGHTLQ